MTRQQMIDLVNKYFAAVDGEDIDTIRQTLTPDCVFTVETHGVELRNYQQIEGMFERLWASHAAVKHQNFVYVPDPDEDRIATRFQVVNTHPDGQLVYKSNCNFFEVKDGRFCRVAVYMAGPNTLDKK